MSTTSEGGSGYWTTGAESTGVPAPGELKIKEPRSWKTWQLVVAVVASGLVCMAIGNVTGGGSPSQAATSANGGYKLPPESGAGSSQSSTTTVVGQSSPSTTASSGGSATTTTTSAGGSATTSTTVVTGPATVLLAPHQAQGNWTSTPFTVGGGQWNIGWAFQCTPAPAAGSGFEVYVVAAGASPSAGQTPAVTGTGGSGQSVTPQSTSGSQQLIVVAATGCVWVVKVTGVA